MVNIILPLLTRQRTKSSYHPLGLSWDSLIGAMIASATYRVRMSHRIRLTWMIPLARRMARIPDYERIWSGMYPGEGTVHTSYQVFYSVSPLMSLFQTLVPRISCLRKENGFKSYVGCRYHSLDHWGHRCFIHLWLMEHVHLVPPSLSLVRTLVLPSLTLY